MKLEQLHHFREAVKYKSISIAAEENFISQRSFSASITKLEKELGVTLLRRTTKGVTPTEAGQLVLEKSKIIFDTIEELTQEVSAYGNKGVVKISSIVMFYNHIIPQILFQLRQEEQPFTLSVTTAESAQIISNVSAGIDKLGIILHNPMLLNNDLQYTPLFTDQYVLGVGKQSPYWNAKTITLEEALSQPYIAYREEFQKEKAVWTTALGQSVLPVHIAFRTDDLELLKKLIAKNNYVAFFPKFMFQDDIYLQHKEIRCIPISDHTIDIEVGYIYNKKYKLNRIEQIFIQIMQQKIKELSKNFPEYLLLTD